MMQAEGYPIVKLALEQLLEILPRDKRKGAQELFDKAQQDIFLCRFFDGAQWKEEFRRIECPKQQKSPVFINPQLLKKLQELPVA